MKAGQEKHVKIRRGFVSNSSSSSFIVTGHEDSDDILEKYDPDIGGYEFGWGPDTYTDVHSRINWMMILAGENDKHIQMIKDIVRAHQDEDSTEGFERMNQLVNTGDYSDYAYIDHQSLNEGPELFEDYDKLERFIMNSGSYIKVDNDNH